MNPNNLRPRLLKDFIGKQELKKNLSIYIEAAKKFSRPLDHCLFYGPSGTGKTTLAYIIANEMKTKIKIVQGPNLQKPSDLISILSTIVENEIIFIDEIHAANMSCLEILYSAMDDFVLDIFVGKDFNNKNIQIKVAPFCVVAATTLLGNLSSALENRFGIVFKIEMYSQKEIEQIIDNNLKYFNGLMLSQHDIVKIAKASKGIPRIANRLLKRINDFWIIEKNIGLILDKLELSESGLDKNDLKYLHFLNNSNSSVGLKTISHVLDEDIKSIENRIEPFLLQNDLIKKTIHGRVITEKGRQILKQNAKT